VSVPRNHGIGAGRVGQPGPLQGAEPVDELTRLLEDLVSIPSVNPMGRSLAGPDVLETRLSNYLEDWFVERGIPCRRQPVSPGRDNLLAHYQSPGSHRTLLFDVHQDTVPTDGMTIDPFVPRIEGGRLYGRGACDIKGGMAAMLMALARLSQERSPQSASVILACTVDEEFTHTGSSRLAETQHAVADLAIVAEPTHLDLVHCHKGALRWKIHTRGVACHSSTPHLGVNAIYRMGRVLGALVEYGDALGLATPDPILGPPSLSVGRIEGGQSVNVVPDFCEIEIDRRLIPGEEPKQALEAARAFLNDRLGTLDGIEFGQPWVNMPALAPNLGEWVGPLKEAVKSVIGREPEVMGVPYGTDAGPLGTSGLQCVVFGPGDIAQAHTKDEWVQLDEVRQAAEAYFQIACALG
jgi:acetylornithine deacetylase/succinyl-diaminopimelate desuccinylase family protein